MSREREVRAAPAHSRRAFLARAASSGAAALALRGSAWPLVPAVARAQATPAWRVPARASRCIYLFMTGGPSQMDLFDPKPELTRRSGQTIDLMRRVGDVRPSVLLGSKRRFERFGQTGQWCCDLLPNLARHMDKLAVVKSLCADSFAHGSALLQMNSGQIQQGHPSLGAWISYGLGSGNPELPTFAVFQDPRGGPISGPSNWSSGYLPAEHQGMVLRAKGAPVLDLEPEEESGARARQSPALSSAQLDTLARLNALHRRGRTQTALLRARQATYELARQLETSAPEALDIETEDEETRSLYGLDLPRGAHPLTLGPAPFGRQCLLARRLIERGVRFVQLYHGGGHQQQTWDAHGGVEENLAIHCPEIDVPIAGLLTDLERRGLLADTLVIWGGEFGRMPTTQAADEFQSASDSGRDHNPKGFCVWLAGAGVRPGPVGETDELGIAAAVDVHPVRDFHATVLRLMGLDHERLTVPFGGLERRLTGVLRSAPIQAVLA